MAIHEGKITKRVVDGLEHSKADPILWDGQLKGFLIRANADGSKTYWINYKNKFGKERRFKIGKHGGKLTAEMARAKADELLSKIRLHNFDPQEQRGSDKKALTVNELLDAYLDSAKFAEKADSTQYVDRGRINRHLRPTLGKVMVESLTPEHIRKAKQAIASGKTSVDVKTKARGRARVSGGEGAARMAVRVFRAILSWAIKEKTYGISENPASGIELGNDDERDSVLQTPEQYAALFRALDTLQTQRRISDAVGDAIRILALTGARRNEIAALKWHEVDLERGLLILPPIRHKTDKKGNKKREIALSAAAQAIIANRSKKDGIDYVFPPSKPGGGPVALSSKLWKMIREEAGLPDGITNHSLRHSLGSMLAIQGAQAAEIMTALGHTQLSTTQRYIHFAQDAKSQLIEKHTAVIAGALEDNQAKAEVINLKDRRK